MARLYVPTAALAEDVVQETWLGVLHGIDRFEGRSSLKTWIFRILTNIAKTRGTRERRTIPFSCAVGATEEDDDVIVGPERFLGPDHRWAGHWAAAPGPWATPEEALLAGERRTAILRAIEALCPAQREVITLRDLQGWESTEVCDALSLSPENQRVLLHRARTKVRNAIDVELGP
jgi:RNA polymerase sigma-70 factor, ECF subfamily